MMLRLLRTGWLVRGREVNSNIHPSARQDGNKLTLGEDTLETSAVSHTHLYSAWVSSILLRGPSTDVTSFSHANDTCRFHSSPEN